MADQVHITIKAKSYREPGTEKFHIIVGTNNFKSHRLRGADCRCEPKVERVKDKPNARLFCHHTKRFKCL